MYVSFLERSAVRGDEPDAETAAAREEELEALEAIFSDAFQRDRSRVRLDRGPFPGDIYLAFEMRGSYPAAGGALRLTVVSDALSLAELPQRASRSIARSAGSIARRDSTTAAAIPPINTREIAGDFNGTST